MGCSTAGAEGVGGGGGVAPGGGGGGGGGGGIFGGGGGGGGEAFEFSQFSFEDGGGGGGGGGSSGVPAAGVGRVSGFLQLLTALGAQPSISLSWTVPPPGVVLSPPTVVKSPPGATTTPTITAVPTISGLTIAPTRFKRGRGAATIARAAARHKATTLPTSTTISFALSQPATVTLSFETARSGVLVRGKCAAPTKRRRRGRRCTRYVAVPGAVRRAAHSGTNRIRFRGVLDAGFSLAPGSYRLSLSAANARGTTSAPQHPGFTLLP